MGIAAAKPILPAASFLLGSIGTLFRFVDVGKREPYATGVRVFA